MFKQTPRPSWSQRPASLLLSIMLHLVVLAAVLYQPLPRLLTPISVQQGENGTSLTRLYWPDADHSRLKSDTPSGPYHHPRSAEEQFLWQRTLRKSTPQLAEEASTQSISRSAATPSGTDHDRPAGADYGSLASGPISGDEIRPALPIATADPFVYPWQLPDSEGNVVVEVTIDERGEIVDKRVLQSLGSSLDSKALAALEKWRFHPATKDGIAIASRQDMIFHFKARG